jgi:hypothetical protein
MGGLKPEVYHYTCQPYSDRISFLRLFTVKVALLRPFLDLLLYVQRQAAYTAGEGDGATAS